MSNDDDYTQYSSPHDGTGTSVSFGGTAITGVFSLRIQGPAGPSKGRDAEWTDQAGTCSISFFGGMASSAWHDKGQLVVSGGGVTLNQLAYIDSLDTEFELNGLVRSNVLFKFIE